MASIRLALTSDLHGHLPPLNHELGIPKVDVAVFAGDLANDYEKNPADAQWEWLDRVFFPYLARVPADVCVVIPGNHDWALWEAFKQPYTGIGIRLKDALARYHAPGGVPRPRIVMLMDESYEYVRRDGAKLRFFGLPWTPTYHAWAFQMDDTDSAIGVKYQHMPLQTSVLISHGPPELGNSLSRNAEGQQCGSTALTKFLRREYLPALKLVVCGHIHEGYGLFPMTRESGKELDIYNVAFCGVNPRLPKNSPVVLEVESD